MYRHTIRVDVDEDHSNNQNDEGNKEPIFRRINKY
jgi:hypothetical protein